MADYQHALGQIIEDFNFNITLKPEQAEIITAVCSNKDVFGILPTGFGKSMTYTLTPLLMDKIHPGTLNSVVVVSPLKALMADQVTFLREHGISAAALTEDTTVSEIKAMGHISVLFTSPEAAVVNKWRRVLKSDFGVKLCSLVFDEAHCISSWGHDFRPAYRQIPTIQSYLDAPNLILTATANRKIQEDIYELLGFESTSVKVVSVLPNRPNIFLDIRPSKENFEDELSWLLNLLREGLRKKIIVYVNSINKCYQIFLWLTTNLLEKSFNGEPSPETRRLEMFHSSTDADSKNRILNDFIKGESNIELLVSTVAFGMGVNVPNIDVVVHWGAPSSALRYWQEVGRCGRDGRASYAICYAFRRSINRCDDSTMKDLYEDNRCIRHGVLEQFLLAGMERNSLHKLLNLENCNNECSQQCQCRMCLCCVRCHMKCQCKNKSEQPLDSFISK